MADRNGHCSPTLERFLALYDNSRIVGNSSLTGIMEGLLVICPEPAEICNLPRRLHDGFGNFGISFLRIDDLPASDCVAHL